MSETVAPSALSLDLRPLADLVPYARNSRKHSPESTAKLRSAMVEFGFTNPVLIDGVSIVAGHGRVLALDGLYQAGQPVRFASGQAIPVGMVPVINCAGWSDAQRKAYVIWDNRSAELSEWDLDMLRIEISDLQAEGFDLSLTGFETGDLAELFASLEPTDTGKDPDDCPPVPVVPHSQVGDVWVLGPHRVSCGDSTDPAVWAQLMQGELADACWTDPPYNVAYESKLAGSIKNDDMEDGQFLDFLRALYGCYFSVMKPGAAIYVAHADTEGLNFRRAFVEVGFKLSGCLIWRKDSLVLGRSDYQWQHEPILYGWKPGSAHKWFGGRKLTTVVERGDGAGPIRQRDDGKWVIEVGDSVLVVDGQASLEESPSSVVFCEKPKRSADHPTMKPISLIEKQLKVSARPGDIVIDGCGGSGSTLVAAERLGMCARLNELDPKFVDVICRRYYELTGRVPVHAETGAPFPTERPE